MNCVAMPQLIGLLSPLSHITLINKRTAALRPPPQPTGQRERQIRRFKYLRHIHRFLSVYSPINNLFLVGRHLMRAAHYHLFRDPAFSTWPETTIG